MPYSGAGDSYGASSIYGDLVHSRQQTFALDHIMGTAMARFLSSHEKGQAIRLWPNMDVNAVIVTDEATRRYNCVAWTLGVTTAWIWPWGSRNPTKVEFDAFYQVYGFSPAATGAIAAFGVDLDTMTHVSISGPDHGPCWESKAGAWLRIQHGLQEMEGGSLYGDVLVYYQPLALMVADLRQVDVQLQTRLKAQNMKANITLTVDQLNHIKARASRVSRQLKERFDTAYAAWKSTWDDPQVVVSSSPVTRIQSVEFVELISLGPAILPLLMEKLTDPDEFFALVAVDRLIRPELRVTHGSADEAVLLGEQGRAIETVQRWIGAET